LIKINDVYEIDDKIYVKKDDKFYKYQKSSKNEFYTYQELINKK
jgi:hypothetical protein